VPLSGSTLREDEEGRRCLTRGGNVKGQGGNLITYSWLRLNWAEIKCAAPDRIAYNFGVVSGEVELSQVLRPGIMSIYLKWGFINPAPRVVQTQKGEEARVKGSIMDKKVPSWG